MNVQRVKEKVAMLRDLFRSSMDFLDEKYDEISEGSKNKSRIYLLIENRRAEMIQCISQCIGHHQTEETKMEEVAVEIERIKSQLMEELEEVKLEEEAELV